jgi:predicted transcriptional regulator
MPLGLYTSCEVTAPCGLCSADGIIGLLDVPDTFLDPDRMKTGLIWFTRGYLEYQFPNNARLAKQNRSVSMEFSMELSLRSAGHISADWPSDITVSVNGTGYRHLDLAGRFRRQARRLHPDWWKLKGSQYGKLKSFRVNGSGTYVDGVKISPVSLKDLDLDTPPLDPAEDRGEGRCPHPGGINIFGRGFGNYDQDIVLRIETE